MFRLDADFYPFGGERDVTMSCMPSYKFEGKERDSETQNDDFGARYYSWRVGRWLSADWSAVPAPVPYANLTNPQTLNLYAMVRDNPETFADLDGHNNNEGAGSGGDPGYCSGDKAAGVGCQFILNHNKEFGIVKQQQAQQQNTDQNKQVEHRTVVGAGIAAERKYNPTSIKEDREYAGWIEKTKNGKYVVDPAHPGTQAGSDPGPRPKNAAGEYHTHGGNDPGYDNEHFSNQDKWFLHNNHVPGF